jgi:DNA-binding beta-propeller fold protein YncE
MKRGIIIRRIGAMVLLVVLTAVMGAIGCGAEDEGRTQETTSANTAAGQPVIDVIEVGGGPAGVAVGDNGVWVARNRDDAVSRIDPELKRTVGAPIPVGDEPLSVAAGEGLIWVANAFDDTVTRIDPHSTEVVGYPIRVGDGRCPSRSETTVSGFSTRLTGP